MTDVEIGDEDDEERTDSYSIDVGAGDAWVNVSGPDAEWVRETFDEVHDSLEDSDTEYDGPGVA